MTKKIFYLQFSIILLIFVFPPIFVQKSPDLQVDFSRLNYFSALNLLLGLFLLLQKRARKEEVGEKPPRSKFLKALSFSSVFLLCFGSLLLCGILFWFLKNFFEPETAGAILPKNLGGWASCAFLLLSGVVFEESLYRWYLPAAFSAAARDFFRAKNSAKPAASLGENEPSCGEKTLAAACFSEAVAVILFALAHRWQGLFAVLNALFAAVILRLSAKKAKSLVPGILAHLLYNAASLALAAAF